MNSYKFAVNTFAEEEIAAAAVVLHSGKLTMGERVKTFETEFAKWVGIKHALMVNSGSSANLIMVDAMLRRSNQDNEWKPGDEVIVPALAWPTTIWPLVQLGLRPVLVDVNPETLSIDLESAGSVISSKTKGMFLTHVLGQVPQMDAYLSFCDRHRLQLLEDSCESLGAFYRGKHAGTFGKMGSFSCYFSHHISTVEGGIVVCGDSGLHDDLTSLRAHGWLRERSDKSNWTERNPDLDERFFFVTAGYNFRPTEVQGTLGCVQLAKLDQMLDTRERLARNVHDWARTYAPWIRLIGSGRLPAEGVTSERTNRSHSWLALPFRLDAKSPVSLRKLKEHFEDRGVETRPILAGNLARHPGIQKLSCRTAPSFKHCDELLARGFMIGCHAVVSSEALAILEATFESVRRL